MVKKRYNPPQQISRSKYDIHFTPEEMSMLEEVKKEHGSIEYRRQRGILLARKKRLKKKEDLGLSIRKKHNISFTPEEKAMLEEVKKEHGNEAYRKTYKLLHNKRVKEKKRQNSGLPLRKKHNISFTLEEKAMLEEVKKEHGNEAYWKAYRSLHGKRVTKKERQDLGLPLRKNPNILFTQAESDRLNKIKEKFGKEDYIKAYSKLYSKKLRAQKKNKKDNSFDINLNHNLTGLFNNNFGLAVNLESLQNAQGEFLKKNNISFTPEEKTREDILPQCTPQGQLQNKVNNLRNGNVNSGNIDTKCEELMEILKNQKTSVVKKPYDNDDTISSDHFDCELRNQFNINFTPLDNNPDNIKEEEKYNDNISNNSILDYDCNPFNIKFLNLKYSRPQSPNNSSFYFGG
ncbi:MAG: hypothetical protein RL208_177 [Pseudomonadota bacterium]|jgi:hypothetical protein